MGYIDEMRAASNKGPREYLLCAAKWLLQEHASGPNGAVGAWETDAWCDLRNAIMMCEAEDELPQIMRNEVGF